MVSDQDEGELGIVVAGSPVTLIQIQELLAAKELCAHRVWQREDFKDFKAPLAEYMDPSASMYKILEYSLTRLTVYKKSRPLTSKRIGAGSLIPILQNVEQWMVSMGWTEDAVGEWITLFAQPILDGANRHLDETYDHIKSAIGSVLEGSSYSDKRQRR